MVWRGSETSASGCNWEYDMFFNRLHKNHIALLGMLLTAAIFGFFGHHLYQKTLTFEEAKGGAFFVWACVALLILMRMDKGSGRLSVVKRDMGEGELGLPKNCSPGSYLPPSPDTAKSQLTLTFSAGNPVVAMMSWFKRVMSLLASIVGSSSPQMARVTA